MNLIELFKDLLEATLFLHNDFVLIIKKIFQATPAPG